MALFPRAAVAASLLLAAPAAPVAKAAASQSQCFARREINGFSAPNDHTVYVRVGVGEVFRLDLLGECPDLSFRQSLGLEERPASAWICSPLDATIVYRETGILQRCPVRAIHRLSTDEIKALPKKDRP